MAEQSRVGIRIEAEGQREVVNALKEVTAAIKQLESGSMGATAQTASLKSAVLDTAKSFAGYWLGYRAITSITGALSAAVREGIAFNAEVETATLGIASLIVAQTTLTDATGRRLEGEEALTAAMAVSEDQVQKLRVAGLQTAATTQQLIVAFQQAVAAGLGANMTLDQIRKVTVQLTNAAGAVGVPFYQLSEEVRSILSGTINFNSRVAKALNISNEMVKSWKQQGIFFEMLNQKLHTFEVAGQRIAKTWAGVMSNTREALSVLAGSATQQMFDRIKRTLNTEINKVFDFDTATISPLFKGLLEAGRTFFGDLGAIGSEAILSIFQGLQTFSKWLDENRQQVAYISAGFRIVVEQIGTALALVGRFVAQLVAGGVETGVIGGGFELITMGIAGALELLKGLFAVVTDGAKGIESRLLKVAGLIVRVFLLPLQTVLDAATAIGKAFKTEWAAGLGQAADKLRAVPDFLTTTADALWDDRNATKQWWGDIRAGNTLVDEAADKWKHLGEGVDFARRRAERAAKGLKLTGNAANAGAEDADKAMKGEDQFGDMSRDATNRAYKELEDSLTRKRPPRMNPYDQKTLWEGVQAAIPKQGVGAKGFGKDFDLASEESVLKDVQKTLDDMGLSSMGLSDSTKAWVEQINELDAKPLGDIRKELYEMADASAYTQQSLMDFTSAAVDMGAEGFADAMMGAIDGANSFGDAFGKGLVRGVGRAAAAMAKLSFIDAIRYAAAGVFGDPKGFAAAGQALKAAAGYTALAMALGGGGGGAGGGSGGGGGGGSGSFGGSSPKDAAGSAGPSVINVNFPGGKVFNPQDPDQLDEFVHMLETATNRRVTVKR